MKFIDRLLNGITMYRLVLYVLIGFVIFSEILALFGKLSFTASDFAIEAAILLFVTWTVNAVLALYFGAPRHNPSVYITALILTLIVTPASFPTDIGYYCLVATLAVASKYIFSIQYQHIVNPAAAAVVLTGLLLNRSATWWVGTDLLFPVVLIGGFLVVKKVRRFDIVFSGIISATVISSAIGLIQGAPLVSLWRELFILSPLLFFATIMLTEPLTMPGQRRNRILMGIVVGILFSPQVHFGSFYAAPELALVLGNIVFYLWQTRSRHRLTLLEKKLIAEDTYELRFKSNTGIHFAAGQYMEWTVPHHFSDRRGLRRFFTIASAPEDNDVVLGIKIYPRPSTYKQTLLSLQPGDTVVAANVAGDFVLPKYADQPVAFLAGGIGVTPFRSMLRHMIAVGDTRAVTLLYSNRSEKDIAYRREFDEMASRTKTKIIYTITDERAGSDSWNGRHGFINADMIQQEIPDYFDRVFYVSGSHAMVEAMVHELRRLHVAQNRIVRDYFPGLA